MIIEKWLESKNEPILHEEKLGIRRILYRRTVPPELPFGFLPEKASLSCADSAAAPAAHGVVKPDQCDKTIVAPEKILSNLTDQAHQ